MREWLKEAVCRGASEIGAEVCHQVAHGAHESAALLFNGSAFVMYAHAGKDDPNHGLPEQAQVEQGREM